MLFPDRLLSYGISLSKQISNEKRTANLVFDLAYWESPEEWSGPLRVGQRYLNEFCDVCFQKFGVEKDLKEIIYWNDREIDKCQEHTKRRREKKESKWEIR